MTKNTLQYEVAIKLSRLYEVIVNYTLLKGTSYWRSPEPKFIILKRLLRSLQEVTAEHKLAKKFLIACSFNALTKSFIYIYLILFKFFIMAHILICHTDSIIVRGLEAFLSSSGKYQIYTANNYLNGIKSASFLQELGETFVLIVEGKILDSDKCRQLAEFDRARLILCDCAPRTSEADRSADHNSLLLALNCNSSYISLEHNEPHNLALAVQCAFVGSVFICPQVKKQLSQYVFQSKLEQR